MKTPAKPLESAALPEDARSAEEYMRAMAEEIRRRDDVRMIAVD